MTPSQQLAAAIERIVDEKIAAAIPAPTLTAVPDGKADGYVSIEGAAEWLEVSETTVKGLLRAGELPYVRVASLRRIDVADLRAYVERQRADITPTRRARRVG